MSMLTREAMLVLAINDDDAKTVRQILKSGIAPNIEGGNFDEPVIVLAARRPDGDILEALVEAGANVDTRSKKGETALMAAVRFGHRANIEYLLEKGANASFKDEQGDSAVSIAENLLEQNYLNVHSNALNGALTKNEEDMIEKWQELTVQLKAAEKESRTMSLKNPISVRKPLTFRR